MVEENITADNIDNSGFRLRDRDIFFNCLADDHARIEKKLDRIEKMLKDVVKDLEIFE